MTRLGTCVAVVYALHMTEAIPSLIELKWTRWYLCICVGQRVANNLGVHKVPYHEFYLTVRLRQQKGFIDLDYLGRVPLPLPRRRNFVQGTILGVLGVWKDHHMLATRARSRAGVKAAATPSKLQMHSSHVPPLSPL